MSFLYIANNKKKNYICLHIIQNMKQLSCSQLPFASTPCLLAILHISK